MRQKVHLGLGAPMSLGRTTSRILMLAVLAFIGYVLVTAPGAVLDLYEQAADLSPFWRTLYLGTVSAGAALLTGLALWTVFRVYRNTRRKRTRRAARDRDPSQLSRGEKQQQIADNIQSGADLSEDPSVTPQIREEVRAQVERLQSKRERRTLEIVAFGTISSGKSSLLNALAGRDVFRSEIAGGTTPAKSEVNWPSDDRVLLIDTPGLAEIGGEQRARESAVAAEDSDLVLFVVDGPLKDYEMQLLRVLGGMEKRILVCLNKQDWFTEEELRDLTAQIKRQTGGVVPQEDVIAVRARPALRRRVRVLPDGGQVEESVEQSTDISALSRRMLAVVRREGQDLLLANLLMQSRGLVDDARRRVQESLDRAAEEIVHRTMWMAGGAVAVNPVPLLDLAGGSAITVKMVLDLARVYHQEIDAETVVNLLGQLGKNLIAMLGASAASPALAAALGSMLKTVPGIGTVAGGLLQGLVLALVTLWFGSDYRLFFVDVMVARGGGFAELARAKWKEVTRPEQLRKLVQAGRRNLMARGGVQFQGTDAGADQANP